MKLKFFNKISVILLWFSTLKQGSEKDVSIDDKCHFYRYGKYLKHATIKPLLLCLVFLLTSAFG